MKSSAYTSSGIDAHQPAARSPRALENLFVLPVLVFLWMSDHSFIASIPGITCSMKDPLSVYQDWLGDRTMPPLDLAAIPSSRLTLLKSM